MPADISEITWEHLSASGIDADWVSRHWTHDGRQIYNYVPADGVLIAFGPATTETGEPAEGWDIAVWNGDEHVQQDWQPTAGETLSAIARWAAPGGLHLEPEGGESL